MKIKIVIDVVAHEPALAALRKRTDCQLEIIEPLEDNARELDAERIHDADVLFCTLPPTNHVGMRNLKWIQIASVGFNQLSGLDLPARGVRATNARGCFDVPIAEWNIAMMVNLARDLRQLIRNQDAAVWDRSANFQRELRGATVGLWGYGGIGRETARLARQMGLRVHVMTRNGVGPARNIYTVPDTGDPDGVLPDRIFKTGEELEFLRDLDFLILALPLSKATGGLIGERELRSLPRRAWILNPARGPIIQQKALLQALEEKWIAGAALDTHYEYPMPPEHPLWKFPNVIFTPHISGSSLSPNYNQRLWEIFSTNVNRFIKGEPLLNELTPAQLADA
ncbi:MAG: D-2-hydroxyacid dehydrogenase [Verrucomicrobiota bacterium]